MRMQCKTLCNMGIFSKLKNRGVDLAKVANAVANIKHLLDNQESIGFDPADWFIVAWVCRVGVIDVIERNNWPMTDKLFVPFNNKHVRMTLNEAYMMSVGRLSRRAGYQEEELRDAIFNILEKGELFYEVDRDMPLEKKNIFR